MAGGFFFLNIFMIELHFKYDYDTFGAKPKRTLEKIEDIKILFYGVSDSVVELIVMCPDEASSEKVRSFFAIAFELLPKKVVKL